MRGKPTPKQLRFVLAYVGCFNAAEAARQAGYSHRSAEDIGRQLLRNPTVAKEIERRQGKLTAKLEISAASVIGGMARIAFADPRQLFNADGRLVPIQSLPDDIALAISGIDVVERVGKDGFETVVKKIRIERRTEALHLLAKALGLRGFRPGALDMPPPDTSPAAAARTRVADLLGDASPEQLADIRKTVDQLKQLEQRRLTQTVDGEAEEVEGDGEAGEDEGA